MKPIKKTPTKQCAACGIEKSYRLFTPKSEICKSCVASGREAPSAEPLPLLDEPEFVIPASEINYSSPTAQELAARTLARRRLIPFVKRFKPKYQVGWVHEDISRRLERFVERVERLEEPRLLLCVPVRHGKSELGSRHFPAFVLGKHPDWEIIAASGAQSLAMSFSRYLRDLIRNPSYGVLFPQTKLDPASQSIENWSTTAGGGYLAAGVGTMITGRGAHILLIDDPVKDAEAADSQTQRDNIWEWYLSTALSRLAPGGGVLVIMTWWNEDDLAGRLQQLNDMEDGDKFEVIKYPAINDLGDEYILEDDSIVQLPPGSEIPENARMTRPINTALHPARYTLKSLLNRKATYYALGQQRWWAALYQQNPTPDEGAYFTKGMFRTFNHTLRDHGMTRYQAWDFAITEDRQSDWTVGVTAAQDEDNNIYVLDVYRFRSSDGIDVMESVVQYAIDWDVNCIGVEDGQIWKSLESTFKVVCQKRQKYPSYEVLKPLTDKMARAQPLKGRMQQAKVWFPEDAPWLPTLRAEMLRFPAGKHDDQVDALGWVVRLILLHAPPRAQTPKRIKSWKDQLRGLMGAGGGSYMAG